ncbi:hypothetical protein [Sediminimonas qiaohouensis]|uniref:hypothetical protein n=1 Tax=Sediminimonas qiaohouensis TaxID=552061 RepID=UPI000401C067|nr:hypothetical protein [Sediminimonas qiaohouensis]
MLAILGLLSAVMAGTAFVGLELLPNQNAEDDSAAQDEADSAEQTQGAETAPAPGFMDISDLATPPAPEAPVAPEGVNPAAAQDQGTDTALAAAAPEQAGGGQDPVEPRGENGSDAARDAAERDTPRGGAAPEQTGGNHGVAALEHANEAARDHIFNGG